ncbi:MAG: 30S ribosome-binding factor RbfA [Firmicutes bacterium]|nr:30S ribosome-binding factor RbfA [Bacillota bacterium]
MDIKSRKIEILQQNIKRKISEILFNMKDPRLCHDVLTISEVIVSNNGTVCNVHITSLRGIEHTRTVCNILQRASGHIRSQLSKILKIRMVPKIKFFSSDLSKVLFQ